ncbi:MAG: VOC family protein [Proteobacteria bacterium]|nr:VOC family protein [Pseudomonadota bacterium]
MSKLTFTRPMLYTADFEATLAFYIDVLGFKLEVRLDEFGWADLSRDSVEVMIAKPNKHTPFEKAAFTGSIYFNVEDADGLWAELKDKARVCYPIETFGYGMREFAIFDNNGYLLQFGEPVSGA